MLNKNIGNSVTFLALIFPVLAAPVWGQGTQQIESLIAEGQLNQALVLAERRLAENRDDVNLMFLQGLILTRQNKLEQAKEVFIRITEKHPELPEPYNNLAVIYAAEGDYESARNALQNAINTHPSYATAHENLGDIYAKMASRAYNQALELDQENETAREKLLLVGDLFSTQAELNQAVAATGEREQELSAELQVLEGKLDQTEQQTREELDRVASARQELSELEKQRNDLIAELESRRQNIINESAQVNNSLQEARAELAALEKQREEDRQTAGEERAAAAEQARAARQDIDSVRTELRQLQVQRDEYITRAESDQAEIQQRVALARDELSGLLARKDQLDRAIKIQETTSGNQIDTARQDLDRIQAEISRLEQERNAIQVRTQAEQQQLQAQVAAARTELQSLRTELAGLQQQKEQIAAANEVVLADQVSSQAGITAPPPVQSVYNALNTWAEMWSSQDIEGYLAAYSPVFKPADGVSRTTWQSRRRERLAVPGYIRVSIDNVRVRYIGDEHAQVIFNQTYRSDTYNDKVEKTMLMHYDDGRWLIAEEESS